MPWHPLERAALAHALREAGPDAPTLCEGWAARHLAAHVVLRETSPVAAAGAALPPLSGYAERRVAERARDADRPGGGRSCSARSSAGRHAGRRRGWATAPTCSSSSSTPRTCAAARVRSRRATSHPTTSRRSGPGSCAGRRSCTGAPGSASSWWCRAVRAARCAAPRGRRDGGAARRGRRAGAARVRPGGRRPGRRAGSPRRRRAPGNGLRRRLTPAVPPARSRSRAALLARPCARCAPPARSPARVSGRRRPPSAARP